jgi:hypothetical protein
VSPFIGFIWNSLGSYRSHFLLFITSPGSASPVLRFTSSSRIRSRGFTIIFSGLLIYVSKSLLLFVFLAGHVNILIFGGCCFVLV